MREIAPNERLLRRIEWVSGILLVVFTLGAWGMSSFQAAKGVFLGCAITIISFQILKWQLRRAFQRPGIIPSKAGLFLSYYIRYLGTMFVIFLVMYYGLATPIPFLVGLSVMVLSIVLVGSVEFALMKGEK
ncbi:MAG: ATP synthase subunit I [Desulfobacteraceae bacterium]|nr:ATP synthase subunit I [Desulfobacteraceae bacterium]